jgi:hypothetical protein
MARQWSEKNGAIDHHKRIGRLGPMEKWKFLRRRAKKNGTIYLMNPDGRARLLPSRWHAETPGSGSAGASPSRSHDRGFAKYIIPKKNRTGSLRIDDLTPSEANSTAEEFLRFKKSTPSPLGGRDQKRSARKIGGITVYNSKSIVYDPIQRKQDSCDPCSRKGNFLLPAVAPWRQHFTA